MSKKKENSNNEGFIVSIAKKKLQLLDFFSPLGMVGLRIWIALIFWNSGLTKIASWDSTLFLFAEEYKTHEKLTLFGWKFLNPEISAYMATAGELFLPILIITGFWARGAAFFLLCMTAVIEFTYQSFPEHVIWALVLGAILLQGAGRFSWDYFIRANFFGFSIEEKEKNKLIAAFATVALTIYALYLIFTGFIR